MKKTRRFITIERNIRKTGAGFAVFIRGRIVDGYFFRSGYRTLEEARTARDQYEREHPTHRPWGLTQKPRKGPTDWRKVYDGRKQRGVCIQCGDDLPAPGRVSCPGCIMADKARYQLRKERAQQRKTMLA